MQVPGLTLGARSKLAAAAIAAAVPLAGMAVFATTQRSAPPVHARLDVVDRNDVRVNEPVAIKFDKRIDATRVRVAVEPAAHVAIDRAHDRLVLTPTQPWQASVAYRLSLANLLSLDDRSPKPASWQGTFVTQPKVGVQGFKLDGQPVQKEVVTKLGSKLTVEFLTAMEPASVAITVNDQPVPSESLTWTTDRTSVNLTANPIPYQTLNLKVPGQGASARGEPITEAAAGLAVRWRGLVPANSTSDIGQDFKAGTPMEVVVENSPPARPQSGLQEADIVYEYLSEYQVSRMTAIYFNKIPDLIGPVRSCRMINPYLNFAFRGLTMCSGASVGTLHYMFGDGQGMPVVPGVMEPFDSPDHYYFRSGLNFQPHNLYTAGDRVRQLRSNWSLPAPDYVVDTPHPDSESGQSADAPSIGQHSVNYEYDSAAKQYLRFDHGTPFAGGGGQLHAKNVVLLHVPFHDAGWIEDETGGAHSVWYDVLGDMPAEIYSNGRRMTATCHMGSTGQSYFQNDKAPYFTDEAGHLVELNTGLTWIHVIGNGQ